MNSKQKCFSGFFLSFDFKLMAGKLTGFPAAALRLYFGGKGGVFYFPLKLLNKCWPSKIAYINHNVISFIGCLACIIFPVIDSVRLSCRMALNIVEDWYKISTKFPTPFNRMILKKEHYELNMPKRELNRSIVINANARIIWCNSLCNSSVQSKTNLVVCQVLST